MTPPVEETIAERVQSVLWKIRSAAERVGRCPESVRLVAVTKTVSVDRIREGVRAGVSIVGENRVQEALSKMGALVQTQVRWHFIGHLQRRKVRSVIGSFELIHSVDSLALASEINHRAEATGIRQDVLLEVNIGGESTKGGFCPEDLVRTISSMATFSHIRVKGLMTIPPPTPDAESARPHFRELRRLAERVAASRLPSIMMDELSMGMSNDYEVAVEEGATLVRVGSAIYGARDA